MPSLLESLQLINPAVAAGAAADFRSALVAILQQLDQDEAAVNRSLQGWWQWLEEEGYEQEGFGLIFNQVCEAKLGEQGHAELLSCLQSNAAEPEGLPRLIEHVQSDYPALAKEIESLEELAVTEEQQLHATAGGTKAGKDTGIAVGLLVGTAATVLVGYKAKKGVQWLANKWKNRGQAATEKIEKDIQEDKLRGTEKLERETRNLENQAQGKEESLLKKTLKDPEKAKQDVALSKIEIFQNKVSIVDYTEEHIKTRVTKLVADHALTHGKTIIEKDIKDAIRSSPEYRERVFKIAEQEPFLADDSSDLLLDAKRSIKKAADAVENGEYDDYFADMEKEIWKSKGTELRANFMEELTSSYTKLLREEVELAKKEAKEDLDNPFFNMVDGGKARFKQSEIIVKEDVLYKAREATALAEKDAEAAARKADKAEVLS